MPMKKGKEALCGLRKSQLSMAEVPDRCVIVGW